MNFADNWARFFVVIIVPLMLFVWALDKREPKLSDIEVIAGVGKTLLIFMA